jgi:hypothetical protein
LAGDESARCGAGKLLDSELPREPRAAASNAAKQPLPNPQTRRRVALLAHNASTMQSLKARSFFGNSGKIVENLNCESSFRGFMIREFWLKNIGRCNVGLVM